MKHANYEIFFEPIVAVKNDLGGFQGVHVSFQSTSSYNIASINSINECTNFVEIRKRGRGKYKRQWAIEMNYDQMIYLAIYCWIYILDGRIQKHTFNT